AGSPCSVDGGGVAVQGEADPAILKARGVRRTRPSCGLRIAGSAGDERGGRPAPWKTIEARWCPRVPHWFTKSAGGTIFHGLAALGSQHIASVTGEPQAQWGRPMIRFMCPRCTSQFEVADNHGGAKLPCPH